jgi:hypothetical protein
VIATVEIKLAQVLYSICDDGLSKSWHRNRKAVLVEMRKGDGRKGIDCLEKLAEVSPVGHNTQLFLIAVVDVEDVYDFKMNVYIR